jgi:hypothetical protein
MPKEQKGYCSGSKGCKDQLLISKAILQECKRRKKNLCMAWIDYQETFDRVPHSWIIKSLELIVISNKVISFTKKVMSYWRTRMRLHRKGANRNRRYKNRMWNISRRLAITTDILHLLNPFH